MASIAWTAAAFATALTGVLLTGCGGGGGGGGSEFVGAASVSLAVTPTEVDTGDNTRMQIRLSDVHKDGVALKVRFPSGLSYVPDSAFLFVDESKKNLSPTNNVKIDDHVYLVFYITQNTVGKDKQGTITIEIKAKEQGNGSVEVDPDVDDPLISNDVEFNTKDPQFDPDDSVDVKIRG